MGPWKSWTVHLLVFDEFEVLDLTGPFEVFAVAAGLLGEDIFRLALISRDHRPVAGVKGLRVLPDHSIDDGPAADILVVPGGRGARVAMNETRITGYVRRAAFQADVVLSVCGGARILARAGLLDGRPVATHHQAVDELRSLAPRADVRTGARVVDAGRIVSTGGISAGIDGALHVTSRLLGDDAARKVAAHMAYDRHLPVAH